MKTHPGEGLPAWARQLSPSALFAGVVVSFVGCCLAGYLASRHSPFRHFERFHALLSPESHFYPTASQVRQMVRGLLGPDDVAVVVGGSSHLHGTMQTPAGVWTRRLQAELGPPFKVINLALRRGTGTEISGPVAEMLCREHRRLVFVTEAWPGLLNHHPDGDQYRYFYWDAFYKNLLLPAPERDVWLGWLSELEEAQDRAAGRLTGGYPELKRRMRLDCGLYFTDLWNRIGYDYVFTLWTPQSARPFTRPRRSLDDNDLSPLPVDQRFRQPGAAADMACLRLQYGSARVRRDDGGAWAEDPADHRWALLRLALLHSFPPALREHLVIVVASHSRYHRKQLPPDLRLLYEAVGEVTVRIARSQGLAAFKEGEGFAEDDYADLMHLTASGGARLARQVAAQVRERARALGYVP
jgi:hypothetical protein